jgi:hypothetical protein
VWQIEAETKKRGDIKGADIDYFICGSPKGVAQIARNAYIDRIFM